jgi:hypothetical protein
MLKTSTKVDGDKFRKVLDRMIATPPIRSKELVGASKMSKKRK